MNIIEELLRNRIIEQFPNITSHELLIRMSIAQEILNTMKI